MNWKTMDEKGSMLNTPPTYAIYMAGLCMKWLKKQGGVEAIEKVNIEKAKLLYGALDDSDFYRPTARPDSRSRMNVTFTTPSPELDAEFVKAAAARDLVNLKGHRVVGGIRASIYNAMPIEGVRALVDFMKKFEMKAFQKKDSKKLKSCIQTRFILNRFKQMAKSYELIKELIYLNRFNKQKINENQIFIESFRGDFYSDSPKYLYQYLHEHYGDKYEFVWVMNHKGTKIPGNPKTVKKLSLDYFRQAAKSKYWLINTRQSVMLSKRPEQIMVSTWHGTPLKKLGFDMGNLYLDDPQSKFNYKKDSADWNYLISPNEFTTEKLRSSFAYEGEVLEYGYPRNDILYNYTDEMVDKIKSDLNLPKDKKVILYAPTWRDDESYDIGKVRFNLKLDLDNLKESLSDEYIVLIRTHYFIANNLDLSRFEGFVFDVSKYEDIAELYLISDILITDYSSVFFDFANLKRPILFYTYDLDKYSNMLRGFYMDIHTEVPGPLLYTTDEVVDAIKNIDSVNMKYHDRYEEFYKRFCSIDDGNASKRIVEKIWG